ncbi:MAG: hypothetical protein N2318_08330 [Meiothermus sp.]|nr:hypothetical protein [Meiothermus sp.]
MKQWVALVLLLELSWAQQVGNWTLQTRKDPVTDEVAVYALSVYTARGFQDSGVLLVRCQWGQPDIFLATQRALNSGMVSTVYRFDRNTPRTATFLSGTSGTSVFVPAAQTWTFFQGLQNASRLALRVQDYQGVQRSYIFDISGFKRIAARFTCFKKPDPNPPAAVRTPPPPPRPQEAARYVNYIQARDLRTYFGFSIEPADGGYYIRRGNIGFKIAPGSNRAIPVNDTAAVRLKAAPLMYQGSLWLPLQFLEQFKCQTIPMDGKVARIQCGSGHGYLLELQPWNP